MLRVLNLAAVSRGRKQRRKDNHDEITKEHVHRKHACKAVASLLYCWSTVD